MSYIQLNCSVRFWHYGIIFTGAVVSSSATQFMATITEGAPMNRSLCIMIMDIGDGLERSIYASLEFMASATQPFSTSGTSHSFLGSCIQCEETRLDSALVLF